ncbi:MAG: ATP-binding protein [Terasakiella sp.]|uniref:ATP-binding protein n=1 Tax=unclassified Terasakiella TaxID=2614952 RepID=UPI003B00F930
MSLSNKKVFAFITVCIFIADALFVAINYYNDRENLEDDLRYESKQYQTGFDVALTMTMVNMSQLATYVANDPRIQKIFALAAESFRREEALPEKTMSEKWRATLYEQVANSWAEMKKRFYVRQLHFHVPPDISLLRVHRPGKWGDDLSPLRYMIVDVVKDQQPTQGFELGRVYAGIRGAVPIYAPSTPDEQGGFIGVLEAGTSFSEIVGTLQRQIGANIAVLLNGKRVSSVKWKTGTGGAHAETCACFIEATSSDRVSDILDQIAPESFAPADPFTLQTHIVLLDKERYMLTSFGLRDYIGVRDQHEEPVGRILMWSKVEHKFDTLYKNTQTNVVYAVFGFLFIEILIFFGLRSVQVHLKEQVKRQAGEITILLEKTLAASRAKSEFLANISHELRTPMMGIKGGLELLKNNRSLDQEGQQNLQFLDNSANAMMSLVDDVLDLSKIEAGKMHIHAMPVQPYVQCRDICDVFRASATEKGLVLNFTSVVEENDWYMLDGLRFRQVLSNLINNAIKFTEEGSVEVQLDIHKGDVYDRLNVNVMDTGIGLSEEQLKRIFERFTQADGSTTKKYGGSGLGLAISQELTTLLGGELTVQSEPEKGSCFAFFLPVIRCEEPHTPINERSDLPPLHILLAEDNLINQKVLMAMLSQHKHNVDLAENGKVAVQRAQKKQYDVILMDVHMPVMDGVAATQCIRENEGCNQDSLIIAFTADAIDEHAKEFIQKGFDDVIVKPVKYDVLESKIKNALNNRN